MTTASADWLFFLGWWLSMDPKDTFFKRLQPLEDFAKLFEKSERFGTWNNKTLGIVLVSGKKIYKIM